MSTDPTRIPPRRDDLGRALWPTGDGLADPDAAQAVARFLRAFHVLLRSTRLYQKNHPRVLESLESAECNLRAAFEMLSAVAVGVEGGRLVVPMLRDESLPDQRGELKALADELGRCRISTLVFLPETNLGELDTLTQLFNSSLLNTGSVPRNAAGPGTRQTPNKDWPRRLAESHIHGIRVNSPIERRVDTALASLMAALLAFGGPAEQGAEDPSAAPALPATLDELSTALRLLAKMTPPLEQAPQNSPQETARAFHAALAEADRRTVMLLVGAMAHEAPREGETPRPYLARLADGLVLECAGREFSAGRVTPPELRELFARLGQELARGAAQGAGARKAGTIPAPEASSLIAEWADQVYAERIHESFWAELPAREKARALRSADAWCVPLSSLSRYLEQLADGGPEAPGREARLVVLNYARCLESPESRARHAVAGGLVELHPLLERLWPNQLPEELSRTVVRALGSETSPGVAGLLAAVTENLARLALAKSDFAEFERILDALERAPRDAEFAHLRALAKRLVADERWLLLVDAALANRPLDPVLPRLLRRDPERLVDRLALILTAPTGPDALPAMARLLRTIGEPALGVLEARLYETRRQRASTAVKLLAAAQPERLVAALPRTLPHWDWSLQDMAVSELSQMGAPGAAGAFLACLTEAHHMVAPMMLDQIGIARETSAVPLLLAIAAGENNRLRDVFIRIKAIEALGRMRVADAADLLRALLRERSGLTHVEPAGLRAAAEEALALIENRPSSAWVRAIYEAPVRAGASYTRPRRYLRIPLESPYPAQIEGAHAGPARVRTISLGGAFLESNRRLNVGDSIRVEIHAGLRRIHSTAVVRNVSPNGGGVEFVHMKQEDREKLRRLVRRLARD